MLKDYKVACPEVRIARELYMELEPKQFYLVFQYIQGVPKNLLIEKKIISEIEHCGAKFYHVHFLGGLDSA